MIQAYTDQCDKGCVIKVSLSNIAQDGVNAYISLNAKQMRNLANWLLTAAAVVDPINNSDLEDFQG